MTALPLTALALSTSLLLQAGATPLVFSATLGSVRLAMHPGDVASRQFQLTLAEDQPSTRFVARFEDWWQSADGQQSFYAEPGTVNRSCAPWTSVNPVESSVDGGETLTVRFTVAVPREVHPGGYWCALTVDQVPDPTATAGGPGVQFAASVSTGLFIEVGEVDRSAAIVDLQVEPDAAVVTVRNQGNTHLRVDGHVEFVDLDANDAPVTVPLPRTTLLTEPIAERQVRVRLPDRATLPPGRYDVRAVVDVGNDHYLGATRQVFIERDDAPGLDDR